MQVSPAPVSQSASEVQPPPCEAPQVPLESQRPVQHSSSLVHCEPSAEQLELSPQMPLVQIALQQSEPLPQLSPSAAHSTVPLHWPLASHVPLQHSDES
jgi:hypothetical protein